MLLLSEDNPDTARPGTSDESTSAVTIDQIQMHVGPEDRLNPDSARPGTSDESTSAVTIDQNIPLQDETQDTVRSATSDLPPPAVTIDEAQERLLYSASKEGNVARVKELLQVANIPDADVNSAFDIAITNNHSDVASVIIGSEKWKAALKNNRPIRHGKRDTPLHRLVVQMPDVAEQVLDRCVTKPEGQSNPLVEHNYEFLDEHYIDAYVDPENDGNRPAKIRLSWKDANNAKSTNLLSYIVKHRRMRLFNHPLVLKLINRKKTYATLSWMLFYMFYFYFYRSLMSYHAEYKPGNVTYDNHTNSTSPTYESIALIGSNTQSERILPCILVGIGIFIEMIQLFATKAKYFTNLTNYLDCLTYLFAILILIDFSRCGILLEWQNQLAGLFNFFAVINFTMIFRISPSIGIYVAMLYDVVKKLMRCFFGLFFIFLAFVGSFQLFLNGQASFGTRGYAFVKTSVMMVGELDFENMFFGDHGDIATGSKVAVFILIVLFLILCVTAINNLMIGLAVSDVARLKQEAEIEQAKITVDLVLDCEMFFPSNFLKGRGFFIRKCKFRESTNEDKWRQLLLYVLRVSGVSVQPIKDQRSDMSKMMEKMAAAELQHSKDHRDDMSKMMEKMAAAELQHSKDLRDDMSRMMEKMSKITEKMAAIELQLKERNKKVLKGRLQTSASMPEFATLRETESYHE